MQESLNEQALRIHCTKSVNLRLGHFSQLLNSLITFWYLVVGNIPYK